MSVVGIKAAIPEMLGSTFEYKTGMRSLYNVTYRILFGEIQNSCVYSELTSLGDLFGIL